MRMVSWDLGGRARATTVSARLHEALAQLRPDVVALSGLVDDEPARGPLRRALERLGLGSVLASTRQGAHAQVLIASRSTVRGGELQGPAGSEGGTSNFLHVVSAEGGWELVGVRALAHERPALKRAFWDEMSTLVESTAARPVAWLGNVRTHPASKCPGGAAIRCFMSGGWQVPEPSGAWSVNDGEARPTRVDHAFLSRHWPFATAAYFTQFDGTALAGPSRGAVSNHAALVLDVPLP